MEMHSVANLVTLQTPLMTLLIIKIRDAPNALQMNLFGQT